MAQIASNPGLHPQPFPAVDGLEHWLGLCKQENCFLFEGYPGHRQEL